jgi:energy-coupling factor transporter ATP-binding protein EcfA2
MIKPTSHQLKVVNLPRRFEALERQADQSDATLKKIVRHQGPDSLRIEKLLHQVRNGGLGRFEIFLGHSGSGKTTFLKTLPQVFSEIIVQEIPKEIPLLDAADYIRANHTQGQNSKIWLIADRDNPSVQPQEAADFFESLRVLFREDAGRVLVCWPMSDLSQAEQLSVQAWAIGRDSLVDLTQGLYRFCGPSRITFYEIAEQTLTSLSGHGLADFGLTAEIAYPLAVESETIAEFYARLEAKSEELNGLCHTILKGIGLPPVLIHPISHEHELFQIDRSMVH